MRSLNRSSELFADTKGDTNGGGVCGAVLLGNGSVEDGATVVSELSDVLLSLLVVIMGVVEDVPACLLVEQ